LVKIGLFIPTYNAGDKFEKILDNIDLSVNISNLNIRKVIIDTFSKDNTVQNAIDHNFEVYKIQKKEFTHGEVRRRAVEYLRDCDYILFMTQDVILHENSIKNIIEFIKNKPNMLVAYGRQISDPKETTIFEQRSRQFNYPLESITKSRKDIKDLGVKVAFSSDAFSVYRREYLKKIGSFPAKIHFCEDEYIAAKAILNDYEVGYCSNSVVTHSNHMNLKQQYKRYKSIGDFHKQNPWIQQEFGSNESEGIKSVFHEWGFLLKNGKFYLIPYSFLLNSLKYIAYKF